MLPAYYCSTWYIGHIFKLGDIRPKRSVRTPNRWTAMKSNTRVGHKPHQEKNLLLWARISRKNVRSARALRDTLLTLRNIGRFSLKTAACLSKQSTAEKYAGRSHCCLGHQHRLPQ